jgi:hypothetical protein
MTAEITDAITKYLKRQDPDLLLRSKEVMDAIYPQFENAYPKDTFRRLFFRALEENPKVVRVYSRNSRDVLYFYARKPHLTKEEIEQLRECFEIGKHSEVHKAGWFNIAYFILEKFWRNPQDIEIYSLANLRKELDDLKSSR